MKHLKEENLGLCFPRITDKKTFTDIFITDKATDQHLMSSTYIAPLYTYDETGERRPNFAEHFENSGYLSTLPFKPTPEDILAYIYAILWSPDYRSKYAEFLKADFPRIPMTRNETTFRHYAELGQQLINTHLLRNLPEDPTIRMTGDPGSNFVIKDYAFVGNKLRLNTATSATAPARVTVVFEGVTQEVWDFKTGSYQPLDKWLQYRRSDAVPLGLEDLQHIKNILIAIKQTLAIMKTCLN